MRNVVLGFLITREKLKRGHFIACHLLNLCDLADHAAPHLVADFAEAFTIPAAYAQQRGQSEPDRIRLLPPYREQLAQMFARYYMRVGLPIPVAPFP